MIFSLAGLKFKTLAESATIHPKRLSSAFKFCCAKCRVEYKLIMDIVTWKQWCSQDALQFHVAAVKLPWNHELWSALICTDFNTLPTERKCMPNGNQIRIFDLWDINCHSWKQHPKKGSMIHRKGYIKINHTHTQIKEWFVVKIPLEFEMIIQIANKKHPCVFIVSLNLQLMKHYSWAGCTQRATHVREEGWIPSRESSNYSTSQVLERYISLGLPYINELSSTCSTTPASRFLVPRVLLLWRCFFLIKALPPIFIPWRGQCGSVSSNFPPPLMTFPVPSSSSQPLEKSFASPKGLRCFVFLHQSVEQEYEQEYE